MYVCIGLAKKFIQVFWYTVVGKPELSVHSYIYIYIYLMREIISSNLIKLAISASSIFFGSFIRISCINNHIIFHSVPFMLMRFLHCGCWKHELFAPL